MSISISSKKAVRIVIKAVGFAAGVSAFCLAVLGLLAKGANAGLNPKKPPLVPTAGSLCTSQCINLMAQFGFTVTMNSVCAQLCSSANQGVCNILYDTCMSATRAGTNSEAAKACMIWYNDICSGM